jgi:tRNA threonylcarbamoyladenosine modification (KEOPS) complex  Pcc1 subunit
MASGYDRALSGKLLDVVKAVCVKYEANIIQSSVLMDMSSRSNMRSRPSREVRQNHVDA